MKINKYIGWAVCSLWMAACQNNDMDIVQPQDSEKYTLVGQIVNNDAASRAQIELGCQSEQAEYFFWNEDDRFTLYQQVENEWVANDFVISEDYSEENGGTQQAEFFSTKPLTPSANYTALYPSPETVTDNKVRLEIQQGVDFTNKQYAAVWKDYFNNNMFMAASGTLSASGRNYIGFSHLCAMVRITYDNQTGSEQIINGVRLKGQNLGYYMNYDLVNNTESESGSRMNYRFTTQGLTVANEDKVDLYILFFPKAIEQTDWEISICQTAGEKTVSLPWKDLLLANGNNASLQAGMRLWFDLTDTAEGLDWTKNTAEEGWVVFEDKKLSAALSELLGNYKVVMTGEGYAKISQKHVNSVYELDFTNAENKITSLAGIEVFQGLQTLKCAGLGIEMDECDLSSLTSLIHVELGGNKLKSLVLPENVWSMNYLDCHDNLLAELDITGLNNIHNGTLICGSQKNNIVLNLTMTEDQKSKWESVWMHLDSNGEVSYDGMSNEAQMQLVAKNGGTFDVTERIRLTAPLMVEGNVILNFTDGAFDGDEGQFVDVNSWKSMVVVKPGASLTINGNPEFNTGHKLTQLSCIRMAGGSDAASKLVMNGGTLIGTYHAILVDEDCQNAEIEINGGSLSCDWEGQFKGAIIFNKGNAKITVKGGNFRSLLNGGTSVTSIETWGGELNISGGNFQSDFESVTEGLSANPNVGNTLFGPAIAIAPQKNMEVAISGGTFKGSAAFFEKIIDESLYTTNMPSISLSITGGTFQGSVMSVDCTRFITGGLFKEQPKDTHLPVGKRAVKNGDYYEIQDCEVVTIRNVGFARALQWYFATQTGQGDKIMLDANGYAIIDKELVESTTYLWTGDSNRGNTFTTLEGIEHFVNLQIIKSAYGKLETCDFSKNKYLKEVYLQNNNLKSLDFSGNTGLEVVYCVNNSNLTSINLSRNAHLKQVSVSSTRLTSLSIPNPSKVESLRCSNLNLTTLGIDFTQFTALKNLEVSNTGYNVETLPVTLKNQLTSLSCSANGYVSLNLSGFTSLQSLYCQQNKLTTLDLTCCTSLLDGLMCGNQQTGTLVLKLTEAQIEKWNSTWKNTGNDGVILYTPSSDGSGNNGASGNDFPVGGIY